MPVGEFIDQVSNSDTLKAVFHCVPERTWPETVLVSAPQWGSLHGEGVQSTHSLPHPQLCAGYDSLEIDTYLRKVNNASDSYPIGKLCTDDPVSVSRTNFTIYFELWSSMEKCWVVFLYQARGVPQYHILLWIDDYDVVLQWIQQRITCRIPEEASNPEIHRLVTKYQYHKCNTYCRRFHHTLSVWVPQTDMRECQPFVCGGVHETISQENLQPSTLTGGDQNQ